MKRSLLSLLILLICLSAFSQKTYFVYLQTENDQLFFVKMNDKVHSSAFTGYLLLSKLKDSSYAIGIGFPDNKFPEQKFIIEIKGRDRGFLLKDFGEKGWGLFDLQTLNIQMALPEPVNKTSKTVPREDISAFTEILAKAANDPSLKERIIFIRSEDNADKPVVQNPVARAEVKPEIKEDKVGREDVTVVEKKDTQSATPTPENTANTTEQVRPAPREQQLLIEVIEPAIGKMEPVAKQEEKSNTAVQTYKSSVVTRKSESSTSGGFGLTFIDEYPDGVKDTVRILIPNPKGNAVIVKETQPGDKNFLDIASEEDTATSVVIEKPLAVANMNCKAFANEDDLSKLQKKMMAKKSEEDMIDEAVKVFKGRCFSSDQVKSLSALFSKDVNKYKFFDAAYAYVSDAENFISLLSELKDEYYIKRFKAMLR